MKTILLVLFVLIVSVGVNAEEKVKVSADIRTGSGFAPLFGLKTSDSWTTFCSIDVQHESGFGIGGYRIDDFKEDGMGRIGFFDIYWGGKFSKNSSLYSAVEYGFFDNNKQMSFICPYVIWSINTKVASINLSPMYCYYDKQNDDQFVFRAQMIKEVYKGGILKLSGWYNNALNHKFYGAIGFTQKLPKNFYLQGDMLVFREGKIQPMLSIGYKL